MPIKRENRDRYPSNWREIRAKILERASFCCEGAPGFFPDCRAMDGRAHPETGSTVVLTVAHLDHTPENCAPDNLRALCQRCHLAYDRQHHAEEARKTHDAKSGQRSLF